MTIQEFMRRWLLRYVREDYFKIPMRKKKEEFELPDALKVHYRYIDQCTNLDEISTLGELIGEVSSGSLDTIFPQPEREDYFSKNNLSIKFFFYGNHYSYRDISLRNLGYLYYKVSQIPGIKIQYNEISNYEYYYLPKYTLFSLAGTFSESALIAYFCFNDQIIGSYEMIMRDTPNAPSDNQTVYMGPDAPVYGDTYYNYSYMYRNNDQGDYVKNLSLETKTNMIKVAISGLIFKRSYTAHWKGNNKVPEFKIRDDERSSFSSSSQISTYTSIEDLSQRYDHWSAFYLQDFFFPKNYSYKNYSLLEKGGLL